MFIIPLPTTTLQIFCEIIFEPIVIVKSVLDPENFFKPDWVEF